MGVVRLTVEETKRRMDEGHRYVDVRTEAEYAAGHPAGALNIPYVIAGRRNPEFMALMQKLFAPGEPFVLGCQSGVRSLQAADELCAAGYGEVLEMRAGYGGLRNAFGQVTEPGWAASRLPCELTTEGGSYAEIKAKVG